jgi:hypothetical protein
MEYYTDPPLEPADYALDVHLEPQSRLLHESPVISQYEIPPDLPTDLAASQKSERKGNKKHLKRVPWSAHVDLRRPRVLAFHQTTHMVKPGQDFRRLPSPRSFHSFGSIVPESEYSLWDRGSTMQRGSRI